MSDDVVPITAKADRDSDQAAQLRALQRRAKSLGMNLVKEKIRGTGATVYSLTLFRNVSTFDLDGIAAVLARYEATREFNTPNGPGTAGEPPIGPGDSEGNGRH